MNKHETATNVRLVGIRKQFRIGDNLLKAIDDLHIVIEPGLTALMGPSGSGKSTLLNLIGALDSPDSGDIFVGEHCLTKMQQNERARFRNQYCGFVFQNFNLIPVLSALENVSLPAQLAKTPISTDVNQRALKLLELVGLGNHATQQVNRLSGGQMQRVAIARALMNNPRVILADEPTANLDQVTALSIMELLRKVAEENNNCVIIATHDSTVAAQCNRVLRLRDGKIVEN